MTQMTDSNQLSDLLNVNRALKTLSAVNRVLVRATEESELLNQICQILVTTGEYPFVWIGLIQSDDQANSVDKNDQINDQNINHKFNQISDQISERNQILLIAQAGDEEKYCHVLQASQTEQANWVNQANWSIQKTVMQGGVRSIALPLTWQHTLLGTLNIYASDMDTFEPLDVEQFQVLADDLSYGLMALRTRTTSQQTKTALKQGEGRLRIALDAAQVSMWNWDLLTGETQWSDGYERLFGMSSGSFDGRYETFERYIHPDDRAGLTQVVQQAKHSKRAYQHEFRIIWQDGSIHWIESRGQFHYNEMEQPVSMAGVIIGIDDRKRTEHELKQAKEDLEIRVSERTAELIALTDRLQVELAEHQRTQQTLQKQTQLLDLAHDTIMMLDLNQTIIFWNHGAEVTYGWSKAEAIGRVSTELLNTQFPKSLPKIWAELMRDNYWEGELIHTKRDGTSVVAASRWVLQRDASGKPTGILEINNDITPRKRVEEALRDSEERFRNAFDNASIGMALIGLEGQWLKVNSALCEIVGYSETELLATTLQTITHPNDLENDVTYRQQLLNGEIRSYAIEKRCFHKQGTIIWTLFNVSLMKNANEQSLYLISQIQDITVRREVERMKDEFISVVSHELRTPLTSIRGSLGLLASGALKNHPDREQRMIEIAAIDIERLVRLVNDILDLERLESGRVTLTKESCNAEDLMLRSVEAMRSLANKETITLVVVPSTARVWASPDHIIQTLTNLLSNAIKFSPCNSMVWLSAEMILRPEPDRSITSFSSMRSAPSAQVCFKVQDQGRGIPPDKLELIFGRFQQVDASDSRKKGGTGLGLAICQSIVHQHDGNIWVESRPGEGSSFYFTVPVPPDEEGMIL